MALTLLSYYQNSHWNVTAAVANSSSYLVGQLAHLDRRGACDSLDVAFAARALHLAGHAGAEAAFEILAKARRDGEDGTFYWGDTLDCDDSLALRSTVYALMVYTERGEYMTEPIVR